MVQEVQAGEPGHYIPGLANIRDLAVPRENGLYYKQINAYYTADSYMDGNGRSTESISAGPLTINIDPDIDTFAIDTIFLWSTDKEILGGKYAFSVTPSFAKGDIAATMSALNSTGSFDTDSWGIGDVFIRPLWLGWYRDRYEFSLGLGVYVPIGKYDEDDDDNIGLGFWTGQIQGSFYYHFDDRATAVMLAGTYEFHGEKDGTDITPGNHFTLESGVSHYLNQRLEVGISGFAQFQLDDDRGREALLDRGVESRISGIAVQLSYWATPRFNVSARYVNEYDAEARFEGDWFTLNLIYLPGRLL